MSDEDGVILSKERGDTEWDVIIAGTGIVESILSCSLARVGKKILHLDALSYYGGSTASLNLIQYNAFMLNQFNELPSFRRSNPKKKKETPLTTEQIQCICGYQPVRSEPISFLGSITDANNFIGNVEHTEFARNFDEPLRALNDRIVYNRYKIKYQIGYSFTMKVRNRSLVYQITTVLSMDDIYECQRVFFNTNRNDFPSTIYLTLDQLKHTSAYHPTEARANTVIFKYKNVLYHKCDGNADSKDDTNTNADAKEPKPDIQNTNTDDDTTHTDERKHSAVRPKIDKAQSEVDENCVCKAIVADTDEPKSDKAQATEIMFYDCEHEIECIIGKSFEFKKLSYRIVDITKEKEILCKLLTAKSWPIVREVSDTETPQDPKLSKPAKDIMISFTVQQLKQVQWITKKRKYNRYLFNNDANTNNAYEDKDEWGDIEYNDADEWRLLQHLYAATNEYFKGYKRFSIDLIPNLCFAKEEFIKVLITSKVNKYVDFRGISRNYVYFDDLVLSKIPLNRQQVFCTKVLTLFEKRQLVKFTQGVSNTQTQYAEDMRWSEYMATQSVSPKLNTFIRYALALLDSATEDPPVHDVLRRLRIYLGSIGQFSMGSFLIPLYGSGDLPSAFSRACAVKGATFILDFCPKAMIMESIRYHNVLGRKGYVFCMKDSFYVVREVVSNNTRCKCECLLDDSEDIILDLNEVQRLYRDNEVLSLIGRRLDYGDDLEYEIVSMSRPTNDDFVIRCDLTPQVTERWRAAKCVYLSLRQLLFVKWIDLEQRRKDGKRILGEDYGREEEEQKSINKDDWNNKEVIRCTGVITKSQQLLHTRYVVGSTDFFAQYIAKVSVKHCRMTVIADAKLPGCEFTIQRAHKEENDEDSSSDDSDSDSDTESDSDKLLENHPGRFNTEYTESCVIHIPPHTVPFNNQYAVHILQFDHYTCCVTKPLFLSHFWIKCGDDIADAKRTLKRCFDILYRGELVPTTEDRRPLALSRTIFEERQRELNVDALPDNVYVVKDVKDVIGYRDAVEKAKVIFARLFPNDEWMIEDKVVPVPSKMDQAFEKLREAQEREKKEKEEQERKEHNENWKEKTEKEEVEEAA